MRLASDSPTAPRAAWALLICCVALLLLGFAERAAALDLIPSYTDPSGQGFHDSELGPARRVALEHALSIWGSILDGTVSVIVDASFVSAGGTGTSAVLASTAPVTLHRDFPGAPQSDTWFAAALANQLSGTDINGAERAEIVVQFNVDIDNPIVLGSIGWYYGLDGIAGFDIDFVSVALHEIGHGLGFLSIASADGRFPSDTPGAYERHLLRPGIGELPFLSRIERAEAFVSDNLFFEGDRVRFAFGGEAAVFAPPSYLPGSSVSHWDPSIGRELLAPFYLGVNHEPGLALAALRDTGWEPGAAPTTQTPKATFTPTQTRRPRPSPTPTRTGATVLKGYVTNFGDDSVSIFNTATNTVRDTLPVGHGPFGIAASPEGNSVWVANFYEGTVTVISTANDTVVATIPLGGAPHSIAFLPDRPSAFVTDSATGTVVEIDTRTLMISGAIPAGRQPAGIAADPAGGRLFTALFGDDQIAVIDASVRAVTARLSGDLGDISGPVAIAVAPDGSFGIAGSVFGLQRLFEFVPEMLFGSTLFNWFDATGDLAITPDGALILASKPDRNAVYFIDAVTGAIGRGRSVRARPQGVAISPDGAFAYVANSGDASVSVLDMSTQLNRARFTVGDAPMRIALAVTDAPGAALCSGDCGSDGAVTVDEIVTAVRGMLHMTPIAACTAADTEGDGKIGRGDLIETVRSALGACVAP